MQKIKQILLFLERSFSQSSIEREKVINIRIIANSLQRFADSGFSIAERLLFFDAKLESYLNAGKADQIEKDPRRIHFESQFSYLYHTKVDYDLLIQKLVYHNNAISKDVYILLDLLDYLELGSNRKNKNIF